MTTQENKKPEPEDSKLSWSEAIEILERHIVHKDYISQSSLMKALERIKSG